MTSTDAAIPAQSNDAHTPTAFGYYKLRNTPLALGLRHTLERFAKTDVTLPDDVVTAYGRSFDRGDPLGDVFIDRAFAAPATRRRARPDVEQALAGGIASVDGASPELAAMFEQIDRDPDWADWDVIEHGAEVFRRYGKELYPYFGMITFVAYALPTISTTLGMTGAYTGGSAFRRYLETCRLWTDTTEPGAMRPGGRGRRSAVLVRVLHSMIRRKLLAHPSWDRARLGVPINQAGMFNTLMASSQFPGQQLKLLGYRPTDDDITALMHLWHYVGYLMGSPFSFKKYGQSGIEVSELFPNVMPRGHGVFRALRDSDIEIEEKAQDLVLMFESALKRRRRGHIIRLTFSAGTPEHLRDLVIRETDTHPQNVALLDGGLPKWMAEGRPLETSAPGIPPRQFTARCCFLHLPPTALRSRSPNCKVPPGSIRRDS